MGASDIGTAGEGRGDGGEVCSLPSDQLQRRLAMIRREILPLVKKREKRPDGFVWDFEANPQVRAKLEELVAFERQCCSGLAWSLQRLQASNTLQLKVEGVDPNSSIFAFLNNPMPTDESRRSRLAGLAKAGGFGVAAAFFIFCLLPLGIAAAGGAVLAARLARLEDPVFLVVGSIAAAVPAWLLIRRRDAKKKGRTCGCG